MRGPSEIRFIADVMLGRLARTLRLLGYDTEYSPALRPEEISRRAERDRRTILTRGNAGRRYPGQTIVFSVTKDAAAEQLREVVGHFGLDWHQGLWTRCTLCNGLLTKVSKQSVNELVPAKALEVYSEFSRCTVCRHVYWQGTHVERIEKNLLAVLESPGG